MLTIIHSIMNSNATGDADFDALQKQMYHCPAHCRLFKFANNVSGCNKRSNASNETWDVERLANVQRVSLDHHQQLHPPGVKVLMEPTPQPLRRQVKARAGRRRTPRAQHASVQIVVRSDTSRPTKSQQVISFAPLLARKSRQRKSRRLQATKRAERESETITTTPLRLPRRTTGSLPSPLHHEHSESPLQHERFASSFSTPHPPHFRILLLLLYPFFLHSKYFYKQ